MINGSPTNLDTLHASYCYDAESGFYYLSARHYDPATYQFISKDPAKADGEESAYQYCSGDPVNRVDATGSSWWNPFSWNWRGSYNRVSSWISLFWHPPRPVMQRVWHEGYDVYRWGRETRIVRYIYKNTYFDVDYAHLFSSAESFAIKMFQDLMKSDTYRTWSTFNMLSGIGGDEGTSGYIDNWSELKNHSDWRGRVSDWAKLNHSQRWHKWRVAEAYIKYNSGHIVVHVFGGVVKTAVTVTTWKWIRWYHVNGHYAWEVRWVR